MPPLDEADLTTIKDLVNNSINGVVSNLKKQGDLARQKDAEALKGDFQKMLDGMAEKLSQAGGGDGGGEGGEGGKGGKGGKNGGVAERELATLRQQVQETNRRFEEAQRVAQAERDKNRSSALRNAIAETLEPLGITGTRFKAAYAMLQQEGRIRYAADDSDEISFVDVTGEVDYRTGLAAWAKSEDAKIFLPPTGTQGAGTRPPRQGPVMKSGPLTPAERNAKMSEALVAWADNPGTNR